MPAEGALRDRDEAGFALIETLRWQPDAGFVRLERHLLRLATSAQALGFSCSAKTVEDALRGAVEAANGDASAKTPGASGGPLRVRLTLAQDGEAAATALPFAPLAAGTVWRLGIAATRLDADDPLLCHKTTRRAVYDAARAEFSRDEADEVLLLNQRGEVCEGTIANVFVDPGDGGPLLTPALACGLLAGVLRAEMLDQGKAREAILTVDDLRTAKAIYIGNSLRGVVHARLQYPHDALPGGRLFT